MCVCVINRISLIQMLSENMLNIIFVCFITSKFTNYKLFFSTTTWPCYLLRKKWKSLNSSSIINNNKNNINNNSNIHLAYKQNDITMLDIICGSLIYRNNLLIFSDRKLVKIGTVSWRWLLEHIVWFANKRNTIWPTNQVKVPIDFDSIILCEGRLWSKFEYPLRRREQTQQAPQFLSRGSYNIPISLQSSKSIYWPSI